MKNLINLLVTLILSGFCVGVTIIQYSDKNNPWFLLYLPLIIMMILWGHKLNNDY